MHIYIICFIKRIYTKIYSIYSCFFLPVRSSISWRKLKKELWLNMCVQRCPGMYVNVVQYNVYKNIFKGNLGLCHNIVWVIVDAPYIGLILFSSFKMLIGTKTFEFS